MKLLLVASNADRAGSAIFAHVERMISDSTRIGEHETLLERIDGSLLTWDPPEGFDVILFLSKHAAASGSAAMCVHAIGNFGPALMGGRDGLLVPTHPGLLTALFTALKEQEPRTELGAYTVSLEAVHHGPYTRTPAIFIELGSTQEHWEDDAAARLIAEAIGGVLNAPVPKRSSFFGIGSNHYCARFERFTDEQDFAGSCAKYALEHLSEDHLRWMAERYDSVVLDKDSLAGHRARIIAMLDALGIPYG
jgi:D-aminoacyl-tRNA deacylase